MSPANLLPPRSLRRSFWTHLRITTCQQRPALSWSPDEPSIDLYAGTYSRQPTPGRPLSVRFRPLPTLDHAGFRVAHGTRSRRLASTKIHDRSEADRVEA